MSSPYLIFLEVALVALALWLHSVLFSLVTFIVLSYFTPKYMYDKTIILTPVRSLTVPKHNKKDIVELWKARGGEMK